MTGTGPISTAMGLVAASLAAMSGLHLSGVLAGGADPFDPTHAGIAEAAICVVLAAGAAALARRPQRARPLAVGAVAFALAGFGVGLSFTVRGGGAADVAYHAVVLPLLLVTVCCCCADRRAAAREAPAGDVGHGAARRRRAPPSASPSGSPVSTST